MGKVLQSQKHAPEAHQQKSNKLTPDRISKGGKDIKHPHAVEIVAETTASAVNALKRGSGY
jgi:hypothetical protein